jgi:hypothetical protein
VPVYINTYNKCNNNYIIFQGMRAEREAARIRRRSSNQATSTAGQPRPVENQFEQSTSGEAIPAASANEISSYRLDPSLALIWDRDIDLEEFQRGLELSPAQ